MTLGFAKDLVEALRKHKAWKKEFLGREEELLCAAASMMLGEKKMAGGERERSMSSGAAHTAPFASDVVSMTSSVERYQLPQTISPEERALLDKGHQYVENFQKHEASLQAIKMGHRLATADYCDTGQEVLMRGEWEVRATPLAVISYWMGHTPAYGSRKERGRSRVIKMGERG
jgi:hypothetical protein